jgi:hypothetical protein
MSTNSLVTLAHGSAVQAISAASSYAVTVARMVFAREHGIPPAEVAVSIECAAGFFEQAPTAEELAIINSA